MRIRISHETRYRYDAPTNGVTQTLRLTPRNHDGHYVIHWRIEVSEDCRLDHHEDAFGNITHTFTAEGPFSELSVHVDGEVETQDTNGVVQGAVERFPPSLFLRAPALTLPDLAIIAFAPQAPATARHAHGRRKRAAARQGERRPVGAANAELMPSPWRRTCHLAIRRVKSRRAGGRDRHDLLLRHRRSRRARDDRRYPHQCGSRQHLG